MPVSVTSDSVHVPSSLTVHGYDVRVSIYLLLLANTVIAIEKFLGVRIRVWGLDTVI